MTSIQITKNAWTKIREILHVTNNKYGMIYSASSGGCNGFNFELDLLTKDLHKKINGNKFLTILTEPEGDKKVYIDPVSEMYLLGTTIDYMKEDYSKKIYENKFIYEVDKNLMTSCGCGISFSPKNI
tara:strand:+ start:1174 stop:1554 length:381 start_codon:yes stop_codon:yes gene_type:complete